MSDFAAAIAFVLKNEGDFVDNPADSGGATNRGLSLRFLREIPAERLKRYGIFSELTVETIRDLTPAQIELIYHEEFWKTAPFENIVSQYVCNYLFDCCVLHGIAQGIKLLQRAMWACERNREYIEEDGILGVFTLDSVMKIGSYDLIPVLMAERAGFMRLVAAEQKKDKEFLDGWLNRAYRC